VKILVALLCPLFCAALLAQDPSVDVGDPAPDFRLAGSDGERYSLEQFRGKKNVVLAWFPKAFTGG
jgi:thioredoxin-dependent peroxiredoxin